MANGTVAATRRDFIQAIAAGSLGTAAETWPGVSFARSRGGVLVIGMDISDTLTYDPATEASYTPPIVLEAAYDTLVTMTPGDYINVKPALATSWTHTADGKGWRFALRKGVKFNSGNTMTIEDVKWSFDRVMNMRAQPWQYITNIQQVRIADVDHLEIVLKDPARPILDVLASPTFAVYERKVLEKHGGVATPDASTRDKASVWLNQHSCGSGPYTLVGWQRNIAVQMERNPHDWRGMPAFQRVVIQHIADPATQLLAIKRGSIDAAFNLVPEQIRSLKGSSTVRVEQLDSLDFVYIALTSNPGFNQALAVREARQAVGYAIDYDGIKSGLLNGAALRPSSFLPIGVLGSTPEVTRQVGFRQDLAKAKLLLKKAGYPDGFSFELSYGNALIAGVSYGVLAEKVQSDLARVGIKAELDPLDPVTMRTQYFTGHSTAVLIFWNPPAVDNWLWAAATVQRVAKRVHWDPPADIVDLVNRAADAPTREEQTRLWGDYQRRMVEQANLIVLFQPIYQVAVRNRIKAFPLTAAGWQVDLYAVTA